MLMVNCQTDATVDDKGRLAMPKPVREALAAEEVRQLVLVYNGMSLLAFTREDFRARIVQPLAGGDPFDPVYIGQVTHRTGTAHDVDLDGQGRIRIPAGLREVAGIGREVHLSVSMALFQIWDRAAWLRFQKESGTAVRAAVRPGGNTVAFPTGGR